MLSGALSGVRILDLTSVLLGPYATLHLADMGADVIKVESPEGDVMRYAGPSRHPGMSPIFLNVNRNKRSIVLDLKAAAGRDALLELAKGADVFVHNMRAKAIAALGLTYEVMAPLNPKLVYCAALGFGSKGQYADDAAYDDVIQGACGIAAVQAYLSGGAPQYVATAFGDKSAGIAVALGIAAALFARERTGQGQQLEVPMFEVMVTNMMAEHLYGHTFEPPLGPALYPRQTSPYRHPYKTRDGYISVMVYNDKQWREFFALIGRPELIDSEKFDSINSRTQNIDQAYQMVSDAVATRTTAEWLELFRRVSIPASRVNTIADLLTDPHLQDVGLFSLVDHPSEGRLREVRSPFAFSRTPVATRMQAPRLGEHTLEVLREAGFSDGETNLLREQGAIVCGPGN